MAVRRLHDELASRQDREIEALGGDLYVDADLEVESDCEFSADPMEVAIQREEEHASLFDYLRRHLKR